MLLELEASLKHCHGTARIDSHLHSPSRSVIFNEVLFPAQEIQRETLFYATPRGCSAPNANSCSSLLVSFPAYVCAVVVFQHSSILRTDLFISLPAPFRAGVNSQKPSLLGQNLDILATH